MLRLKRPACVSTCGVIFALSGCGGGQMDAGRPPSNADASIAGGMLSASELAGTGVTHMLEADNTADNTYIYLEDAGHPARRFNLQDNSNPIGVTFDPTGTTAYVAVSTQFLSIDVATRKILHRVSIHGCAAKIAVTPNGKTALVPCGSSLLLIALPETKVRANIALSRLTSPTGVAVDSSGTTAYVVGNSGMAIVDIARTRQTSTVSLPGGTCWTGEITGVALVEQLNQAYAATCDQASGEPLVAVVDTHSHRLLKTINVGTNGKEWPIDVVASSKHPFVYVSVQDSDGVHGQLVAIDTRTSTVSQNESLQWAPAALAVSPNQSAVFAMTWEGIVWFHTDAKGFNEKEQGSVGIAGADDGFGQFVR
jgi:DNA-binding beta-propeller fold protein YncE